jgi:predicted signal transduction protein with EAL and GGDEF domain
MTPTTSLPPTSWSRRLEARVAATVAALIVVVVAAVLVITTRLVSEQARGRASLELESAKAAFYAQMDMRARAAQLSSRLVTELPVFRAHLTDPQLANDRPTIEAMADGYRRDLGASFAVVTDATGRWLASPGWRDDAEAMPRELVDAIDEARAGRAVSVLAPTGAGVSLLVASPARFADEILGTLSVGYGLTDAAVRDLAHVVQSDVAVVWGPRVAATSLGAAERADTSALAEAARAGFGVLPDFYHAGSRRYVAGTFALAPEKAATSPGRLVLLADWQPRQEFVDRLRDGFIGGGATVLAVGLALGLVLSRRLSRPLRDIAAAASAVAAGDLTMRLPVRGSAEAMTVATAFNDMSASLRSAHDRLVHDAIHDALTHLPNRVLFTERLERAMARRIRRRDTQFAVLFIDLDRFKRVNDSLGHAAGDELLQAFAERLAGAVRREDVVMRLPVGDSEGPADHTLARFGGDEFVVLLDDIRQPVDAVRVAERIQRLAVTPLQIAGQEVFATQSIGIAVCADEHRTGQDVMRDADAAMYRAKRGGGASYAVFDAAMHEAAVDLLRLETDLRHAVERREFRLHYQPIVALGSGTIAGYEALVRWQHPDRGLLLPQEFLPVADELGLIVAVDDWAMAEACRQARQWQDQSGGPEPFVSVNLSARSLGSDGLGDRVAAALQRAALAPSALHVEVTESAAVSDPARVQAVLRELRTLGARVSLDDFGTGYCSLSYLQQFPVDTLKIDRAFVRRIGEQGEGDEIVRLIVQLAETLKLDVVAEGTESAVQVAHLAALGCPYAQGYYFSQAVDPSAIAIERRSPDAPRIDWVR